MSERSNTPSSLEHRVASMGAEPEDAGLEFHAITLTADADGQVTFGTDSHWVGWAEEGHRVELRQSRIVSASYAELWRGARLPFVFVTNDADLPVFLLIGGNALVERQIAEAAFMRLLGPRPCYRHGRAGFVGKSLLSDTALRRAPTPKLRMAVLKRDGRRCRICGRKPDDNVDVVLHVHHIRPWEDGGITDISNLITLCHTCHSGLEPHFDHGLFGYVSPPDALHVLSKFGEHVLNYRRRTERT